MSLPTTVSSVSLQLWIYVHDILFLAPEYKTPCYSKGTELKVSTERVYFGAKWMITLLIIWRGSLTSLRCHTQMTHDIIVACVAPSWAGSPSQVRGWRVWSPDLTAGTWLSFAVTSPLPDHLSSVLGPPWGDGHMSVSLRSDPLRAIEDWFNYWHGPQTTSCRKPRPGQTPFPLFHKHWANTIRFTAE